jgi:oligoendopeptidase F
MPAPTMIDVSNRTATVAKKRWTPKKDFHPGGEKGKLHRELGVAEGEKIPAKKLSSALHSKSTEVRNDAIRAKTMMGWKHGKSKSKLYTRKGD